MKENVYRNISYIVREYCDEILDRELKKVFTIGENTYCGKGDEVEDADCLKLNILAESSKNIQN